MSFLAVVSSVGICTELPRVNPTWDDLVQILDEAPGGLALISGPFKLENCGNEFREYLLESTRRLDIVCCGGDCIIDCPLIQFRVASNATLTLESLTLQNTIRSTLVVEPNGVLISRSTSFLNNQGAGDGGSIQAMEGSSVEVSRGRFENSIASNGGAIHTNGSLIVREVSFWNNQAINLGGAIYGGQSTTASIIRCTFGRNAAVEGGPAVYSDGDRAPNLDWTLVSNEGCMNMIDDQRAGNCDGVEWRRATCLPFSGNACDIPTSAPTMFLNDSLDSNNHQNVFESQPGLDTRTPQPFLRPTTFPTVSPTSQPSLRSTSFPTNTSSPSLRNITNGGAGVQILTRDPTTFPYRATSSDTPSVVPSQLPPLEFNQSDTATTIVPVGSGLSTDNEGATTISAPGPASLSPSSSQPPSSTHPSRTNALETDNFFVLSVNPTPQND